MPQAMNHRITSMAARWLPLALLPLRAATACTCPDIPACTVADLVGEDCSVSADGVLAADLRVLFTETLATLDLDSITRVAGDVEISDNAAISALALGSLSEIDGDFIVERNAMLVELSLPAFVGSAVPCFPLSCEIVVQQNSALETLSLPALVHSERDIQVGGSNFQSGNPALFTVDMSALVTAATLDFTGNPLMEELLLGSLSTLTGYFYIGSTGIGSFNNLPSLELPNLVSVGQYFFLQYLEEMEHLDLSALQSTGSYMIISAAASLVNFELPAFESNGGQIAGRGVSFDGPWETLESMSLPSLTEVDGTVYVRPNNGLTDLAINFSGLNGAQMCVRANNIALGTDGAPCNFPVRGADEPAEWQQALAAVVRRQQLRRKLRRSNPESNNRGTILL